PAGPRRTPTARGCRVGRGPGRAPRLLRSQVPRRALQLRLRGLPRSGVPPGRGGPPRARADRGRALRGTPAPPGAVDGRVRALPPGGEVLQHVRHPGATTG